MDLTPIRKGPYKKYYLYNLQNLYINNHRMNLVRKNPPRSHIQNSSDYF